MFLDLIEILIESCSVHADFQTELRTSTSLKTGIGKILSEVAVQYCDFLETFCILAIMIHNGTDPYQKFILHTSYQTMSYINYFPCLSYNLAKLFTSNLLDACEKL